MKQNIRIARAIQRLLSFRPFQMVAVFIVLMWPLSPAAQAVTGIITDYQGFWKSSASSINSVKPDNSHNLLAFSYNGIQYSTGVNDDLLSQRGEYFNRQDFWALPVGVISGTLTSNTKAGFGALYDGVFNGPSAPPPAYGISNYLTDGIKGLNLGTCIANLPSGSMTFIITNIQPSSIGDGVPDILVTQVADPSGSFDRYEFTDANGVRIGNYKDIVFTNINPVGNWTADFYEARSNPFVLTSGFTQTDRPLRLWAADLSEFGITAGNFSQVRNFKINLSGNSDVAFVAYNNKSVNFQNPLPVQYSYFKGNMSGSNVKLSWQTVSEQNADKFVVERSTDGVSFKSIGTVAAKNTSAANDYSFTDASPLTGKLYYRLRQVDLDGSFTNSTTIVKINNSKDGTVELSVYPNPAKGAIHVDHAAATGSDRLVVYNAAGVCVKQLRLAKNALQTKLDISQLPAGAYSVSYQDGSRSSATRFVIP